MRVLCPYTKFVGITYEPSDFHKHVEDHKKSVVPEVTVQ